ncbi:MAG: flippase, partial [Clostridia bacterium]|nr:flippase [Clostridia bacterium]
VVGTALVWNLASALACVIGVTAFSFIANPNEPETVLICFLYSLTLIFQASEMVQYWFQSKLLSKYPSIATLCAYTIVSVYKIYLLASGKSVQWFALSHVIEALLISVILLCVYRKLSGQRISFSFALGKEILRRSRPYIWSGLMVVVFQQTDRIMLKQISGEAQTGFYSATISCIGITGFVFMAIIDSMRPTILESKQQSEAQFERRLKTLFLIVTALSLLQSVAYTLLAEPLISVIYGAEFAPAAHILRITVWFVTFAYYGTVRDIWILSEGKQGILWIINLIGALTNIVGNLILIPVFGGVGAAIASLVTQIFTNFALTLILKPLRPCGKLMLRSLEPRFIASLISHKKKEN